MKLFLDSSVILAASGSSSGASYEIFKRASSSNWMLLATPFVIQEVVLNLPDLGNYAKEKWTHFRSALTIVDDVLTLDRPTLFTETKDRPILFSALAWSDILLTLDRDHFGDLLNQKFYDLMILRPGTFLERERDSRRIP